MQEIFILKPLKNFIYKQFDSNKKMRINRTF